jgi:hypothetical protein
MDEELKENPNVFKPKSLLFKFIVKFFPGFLYHLHKAIHNKIKK